MVPTVRDLSASDAELFARDVLLSPSRTKPVVALTTKRAGGPFLIDPVAVAGALGDRAEVVTIDSGHAAGALSLLLPRRMDVFGGAVRIWWPGMSPTSDPAGHPLMFIWSPADAETVLLRIVAAIVHRDPVAGRWGPWRPAEPPQVESKSSTAAPAPVTAPKALPKTTKSVRSRTQKVIVEATVTDIEGPRIKLDVGGQAGFVAFTDEKMDSLARRLVVGQKIPCFMVEGTAHGLQKYSVQGLLRPREGQAPPPPVPPPVAELAVPSGKVLGAVLVSLDGGRILVRVGGRLGHVKFADGSLALLAQELAPGQRIPVREVPSVVPSVEKGPGTYSTRGLLRDPWKRIGEAYQVGDIVRGRVSRIADAHLIVELLPEAHAIVPIRELDWTFVRHPSELFKGGELVKVKILSLAPEVRRCMVSIKQALGSNAREPISPGPGEEPFLADAQETGEAFKVGASDGATEAQLTRLQEELESALEDREDLLARLRTANSQVADGRKEVRSLEDRLRVQDARLTGGLDPTSSELAFLAAVRVEYARRFEEADRTMYPLQRMRVGREFMERLRVLDGIEVQKVVEVCAQVASLRSHEVQGRSVHELRAGPTGGPGKVRPSDKAKAWRCSLQENTPSARRLHWWRIPGADGATVEFASVAVHDDYSIPE